MEMAKMSPYMLLLTASFHLPMAISCSSTSGAFRQRAVAAASIVFDVNTASRRAALVNMHSYLLLHSDFMMVQLFQLAAVACCVTVATTEITAKETIQELILLYLVP